MEEYVDVFDTKNPVKNDPLTKHTVLNLKCIGIYEIDSFLSVERLMK